MEIRSLTPRQLLIVVLVACRESGYEILSKQRLVNVFYEMRAYADTYAPVLMFNLSGERQISRELEQAFSGLHRTGAAYDALTGTITVSGALTCAEIYKPLHDRDREKLANDLQPYVAEFVRRYLEVDPNAPKPKPDSRLT